MATKERMEKTACWRVQATRRALAAALAVAVGLTLIAPVVPFAAPPALRSAAPRPRARPLLCSKLRASGGLAAGDRVEILVKTVSLSRKLMASGMDSHGLNGVIKYINSPADEDELAMATVVLGEGDAAFEHLFAEDELARLEPSSAASTTAPSEETAEAPAGLQPQVTANVVVACSGEEEELGEKLALLAALVGQKADVSCSQHATGLSVGGSWDAVMNALAACGGVLDARCALSVTLAKC